MPAWFPEAPVSTDSFRHTDPTTFSPRPRLARHCGSQVSPDRDAARVGDSDTITAQRPRQVEDPGALTLAEGSSPYEGLAPASRSRGVGVRPASTGSRGSGDA